MPLTTHIWSEFRFKAPPLPIMVKRIGSTCIVGPTDWNSASSVENRITIPKKMERFWHFIHYKFWIKAECKCWRAVCRLMWSQTCHIIISCTEILWWLSAVIYIELFITFSVGLIEYPSLFCRKANDWMNEQSEYKYAVHALIMKKQACKNTKFGACFREDLHKRNIKNTPAWVSKNIWCPWKCFLCFAIWPPAAV